MPADHSATVLIAEPSSNAKRNEACRKAVTRAVVSIADSTGGLVLKSFGGRLMLLFSTPDAAASAASNPILPRPTIKRTFFKSVISSSR